MEGSHNQLISLKVSSLVNLALLEKYNRAALLRDRIWSENSQGGVLKGETLFNCFQQMYAGLAEEDFMEYLEVVHNYKDSPFDVTQL